jgi:hypothetical protein
VVVETLKPPTTGFLGVTFLNSFGIKFFFGYVFMNCYQMLLLITLYNFVMFIVFGIGVQTGTQAVWLACCWNL